MVRLTHPSHEAEGQLSAGEHHPIDDGLAHKWLTEGVPDRSFPESGMEPVPSMRLIEQELVLNGIPERNLATALIRFGREGYQFVMHAMQKNVQFLAKRIEEIGRFEVIGAGEERLPLVAFQLAGDLPYDEFDIAWQVAAERGWMLPAYTMPPNAEQVKMLRALVKLNLTHALVATLADDLAAACETLDKKGGLSEHERKRVKTNVGY
jgi:Pyridoxal-dependent decarboxylase conserved domain